MLFVLYHVFKFAYFEAGNKRKRGLIFLLRIGTADHGNADCMWTEKNGRITPMVAHTLSSVPFIIKDYSVANSFELAGVDNPGLSNVAATLCVLLGLEPPKGYDASLVKLAS